MWQAAHRLIIDLKEGRFEAIIPKIANTNTRARTHTHKCLWQAAHRLVVDFQEGRFEAILPPIASSLGDGGQNQFNRTGDNTAVLLCATKHRVFFVGHILKSQCRKFTTASAPVCLLHQQSVPQNAYYINRRHSILKSSIYA
jgi:hypothetical protein